MMDTVTYSEPSVSEAILRDFVPAQCNVTDEAAKSLIDCYRQFWTPDVRILDCTGFELYRWNGYLPPFEFLPQLHVGRAQAHLRLGDNAGAREIYEDVLRRFPGSAVAAEGTYFLGVSRYKTSHDSGDLASSWEHLRSTHPDSLWRVKQSFSEKFPPETEGQPSSAKREEVRPPARSRTS